MHGLYVFDVGSLDSNKQRAEDSRPFNGNFSESLTQILQALHQKRRMKIFLPKDISKAEFTVPILWHENQNVKNDLIPPKSVY